jgi:hypothetical protein
MKQKESYNIPQIENRHDRKSKEALVIIDRILLKAKESKRLNEAADDIKSNLPLSGKKTILIEAANHLPDIQKEALGVKKAKEFILALDISTMDSKAISFKTLESFGITLKKEQKQLIRKICNLAGKNKRRSLQREMNLLISSIEDTDTQWKLLMTTCEFPSDTTEIINNLIIAIRFQECMNLLQENEKTLNKRDCKKLRALVLEEFLPSKENVDNFFSPVIIQDIIEGRSDLNDPWISGNVFDSYSNLQENIDEIKKNVKLSKKALFVLIGLIVAGFGTQLKSPYIGGDSPDKHPISLANHEIFLPNISLESSVESLIKTTGHNENIFELYGSQTSLEISQENIDDLVTEFINNEYEKYLQENNKENVLNLLEFTNQKKNELTDDDISNIVEQTLEEKAREDTKKKVKSYLEWKYKDHINNYSAKYDSVDEIIAHEMLNISDDDLISFLEKYIQNKKEITDFHIKIEQRRKAVLELRARHKFLIDTNRILPSYTEDEFVSEHLNFIDHWVIENYAEDYDKRIKKETDKKIVEESLRNQYYRDRDYSKLTGDDNFSLEQEYVEKMMSGYSEEQIELMAEKIIKSENNQEPVPINNQTSYNDFDGFIEDIDPKDNPNLIESQQRLEKEKTASAGAQNFSRGLAPKNSGGKEGTGPLPDPIYWTIHGEIPSTYFRNTRLDTFNNQMSWDANSNNHETIELPKKGLKNANLEIISSFGSNGEVDIPIPYGYQVVYAQYESNPNRSVFARQYTDGSHSINENPSIPRDSRIVIGFEKTSNNLFGNADSAKYLDNSILLPNPELLPSDIYNKLVEIKNSNLNSNQKVKEVQSIHDALFTYSLNPKYSNMHRSGLPIDFVLKVVELPFADCDVQSTVSIAFLRFVGVPAALSSGFANSQALLDTNNRNLSGLESHGWPEYYNYELKRWVEFDMTTAGSIDSESLEQLSEVFSGVGSNGIGEGGSGEGGSGGNEFYRLMETVAPIPQDLLELKLFLLNKLNYAKENKLGIVLFASTLSLITSMILDLRAARKRKNILSDASRLIENTYGLSYNKIKDLLNNKFIKVIFSDLFNGPIYRLPVGFTIALLTYGIPNILRRYNLKKELDKFEDKLYNSDNLLNESYEGEQTFKPMGKILPELLGLEPHKVVEHITKDNVRVHLRKINTILDNNLSKSFLNELIYPNFYIKLNKVFLQSRDLSDFLSRVTNTYYKVYLKTKRVKNYKKEKLNKIEFVEKISSNFELVISFWKIKEACQRLVNETKKDEEKSNL